MIPPVEIAGLSPLRLAERRLDLVVGQRHGSAHAGLRDPGRENTS